MPLQQMDDPWDQMQADAQVNAKLMGLHVEFFLRMGLAAFSSCYSNIFLPFHF
uniref:Mitogen-activated protein kinase 16 n=1 Tax=Rhizophora mucronata TaxID=61149 RepID=A0A2P2IJC7_RHIMU